MLFRKFVKFAIPSVLSMWIYALYTMVDGIFVARGVGEDALAQVNLSMPYVWLVFSVGILMGSGASTLIAAALGEKDHRRANDLFTLNFATAVIVSILLTILTLLFLTPIARFLGAPDDYLPYVRLYVGTIAYFDLFFILSYNMEALVKTDGRPTVATISVLSCGITNIILDYIFVIRMQMGVFGAAFATGLAQVTSTVIFTLYFHRHANRLTLSPFWKSEKLTQLLSEYRKILPLGLSSFVTELSGGIVVFLYNHVLLREIGEIGVISYTVISYVNSLVLSTMGGIAQGMQPLVSYEYGAENRRNCHRLLSYALGAGLVLSLIGFLLPEFLTDPIVRAFLSPEDGGAYPYTLRAMKLYSFAFLFLGITVISSGYFTAIKKPLPSFVLSLGRGFVVLAVSLIVMSQLLGDTGIWLSAAVSEGICACISIILLSSKIRQNSHADHRWPGGKT